MEPTDARMSARRGGRSTRLLALMARLRDPQQRLSLGSCSRPSRRIAPYTIEEAYEVADAIERDDHEHAAR